MGARPASGSRPRGSPGMAAFEIEYGHWVDEQKRHTEELRSALQQGQGTSELKLQMMVETGLANYDHLFRIKGAAAQSDVFCVMSGLWRSPAERFFLWIGGFRPSEVLKILSPQLQPMTEPQSVAVYGLQLWSAQAEDALSQGMQKLQQTLAASLTDHFASPDAYMVGAVEKLKGLVGFVQQADHLRLETLQNMHRILTARKAAKGLLVLGDYFQRLRALSTLWAQRPRQSATGQMMDPGVAAFEIEYGHWVDEQKRHTEELRSALQQGQGTSELELQMMVETGLANYDHLFRINGAAAQSDVFCVMSGLWRSPAECFFLWIGGFRPSEVLKILSPQLQPMMEPQSVAVYRLQLWSAQAEDALSQGMQKLQQTLAESLTDPFASPDAYMVGAVEKLKGLVGFVQQADHLRLETLQNMHRILTTRQAAKGLLVLGDYFPCKYYRIISRL